MIYFPLLETNRVTEKQKPMLLFKSLFNVRFNISIKNVAGFMFRSWIQDYSERKKANEEYFGRADFENSNRSWVNLYYFSNDVVSSWDSQLTFFQLNRSLEFLCLNPIYSCSIRTGQLMKLSTENLSHTQDMKLSLWITLTWKLR